MRYESSYSSIQQCFHLGGVLIGRWQYRINLTTLSLPSARFSKCFVLCKHRRCSTAEEAPGHFSPHDGLLAGRPDFDSRKGKGIFLLSTASRPALGVHPVSYPTGTGGFFTGSKEGHSIWCWGQEWWSYISYSPAPLHAVILNSLSTCTTLS
jgi:hypothetical protein